jgi:hypothetical protein
MNGAPLIYRAHNCEGDIWERKLGTVTTPWIKPLLRFQATLVRSFENSLAAAAAAVATVSEEDGLAFRREVPDAREEVVPIGYEFLSIPPYPAGPDVGILFLGRLDWAPNREGLTWFLTHVWPVVSARRTDLRLTIAGSGESAWLIPLLKEARQVRFLGRVPTVDRLYEESCTSIVPLFYGSGTRVKVIEACRFGRPCISTALGVEGVGLEPDRSYIRAESAEEWQNALISFDPSRGVRIGEAAYVGAKERFEARTAAERFRTVLDTVVAA